MLLSRNHNLVTQDNPQAVCEQFHVGTVVFLHLATVSLHRKTRASARGLEACAASAQ